jgi:hypothetical protein
MKKEIVYLGRKICNNAMEASVGSIVKVMNWPIPGNIKQLR